MNGRIVSIIAGAVLLVIVFFLAGMWTTHKVWWPWKQVTELQEGWKSYKQTGRVMPADSYGARPTNAPNQRYSVTDQSAISPGLLAINRFDPDSHTYVLDLVDEDGKVLHSRPLDYARIVKGGAHNAFVHIATMLQDGSVLVVFDDETALARLDACGDPIWAVTDQVYHHSIKPGDGGYWTWQSALWNGGQDQRMVRFDPITGDILESLDLIEDVIGQSDENALKMEIPEGFRFKQDAPMGSLADLFHPNDVEPLRAAMADAFPQFKTGDLLISLRNMDMLAVIDRTSHEILWAQYGPWQHQHDADFQPDGTITVFSNNTDRFRSTIIKVDPKTGVAVDMFRDTDVQVDSFIMGKQERLPNGNWLITSTMQGYILETTLDGKIVRQYSNLLNDRYNSVVPYAEHLAPGYLKETPECSAG